MRKFLTVLVALTLFAAVLSAIVFTTDFNSDAVDTHVSLQAEDIADSGDQLVMEKPSGEEPRLNISVLDFETADIVASANGVTANYIQILNKGLPGVDIGQLFVMIDPVSITSQQEVSAHPGNTRPILG